MSYQSGNSRQAQLHAFAQNQPEEGSQEMEELNRDLRDTSIRESTRRQYETPDKIYGEVCKCPVTGERLQIYIRALFCLKDPELSGATISKYVSGMRTLSQIRGEPRLGADEEQQVARALAGARKVRERQGRKRKQAPVLDDELVDAVARIPTAVGSENDQLKVVTLLSIATVSRLDETYSLTGADVEIIETPGKLRTRFRMMNPKTEEGPTFKEVDCDVHTAGVFDRRGVCGVKWCAAHEMARRKRALKNDLFRIFPSIRKNSYAKKLKGLLEEQYPGSSERWSTENITGHSLRRTGSTILKLRDVPEGEVQASGKWRSNAWLQYTNKAMESKTRKHAKIIMGDNS